MATSEDEAANLAIYKPQSDHGDRTFGQMHMTLRSVPRIFFFDLAKSAARLFNDPVSQ
jgi:hypothetical protein